MNTNTITITRPTQVPCTSCEKPAVYRVGGLCLKCVVAS